MTHRRIDRDLLTRLCAAGLLALAAIACGPEAGDQSDRPAPGGPASGAAPGGAPALPALPPVAELRLERRGRLVTLAANQVALEEILRKLSDELDFELRAELPDRQRPVSVRRADAGLHALLDELIPGVAYAVESRWDPDSGLRSARRLWVGDAGVRMERQLAALATRAAELAREDEVEEPFEYDEEQELDEEDFDRDDTSGESGFEDVRPLSDLLRDLDSRDPRLRARAAAAIEPEGRGLDALLNVVERDPDPAVRVAAVERLEDANTYGGVQGLLRALEDRDRRVVIAAMESLEFAGDESNVPELERFLDHPDKGIRRAAREAIDFLGD